MTRVLVCADNLQELSELEAVIRGSRPGSLQLAGSVVGRARLDEVVERTHPDVLLEHIHTADFDNAPVNSSPDHQSNHEDDEDIGVNIGGEEDEDEDDDADEFDDDDEHINQLDDFHPAELADAAIARVLLVREAELADAIAGMRSNRTSIRGVLPEWSSRSEICAALEAAAQGLLVLHPDFAENSLVRPRSPAARGLRETAGALSPREREVLNLLAAGSGNKQIAAQLDISAHTVKFHVTSIFNKLNASSRAEAVAIGARRGLILF